MFYQHGLKVLKMANMNYSNLSIGIIGTGNIASTLGFSLISNGIEVKTVYSRNISKAKVLAQKLNARAGSTNKRVFNEDVVFFCVPDDAIKNLLNAEIPFYTVCVHTSGSTPISVFGNHPAAVLWPLQTFSKADIVNNNLFSDGPVFVEGSDIHCRRYIKKLAEQLSEFVVESNSEQRMIMHLAAVFACNFTNHMYTLAEKICKNNGLDQTMLVPLIMKTATRTMYASPFETQTGPAARNDKKTIKKQLDALSTETDIKKVYKSVTNSIFAMHKKQK